ncbi:ATP-dependent DNA helicase [Enterococcus sp. DIV0242_7C1]|uniref:ATP-dependent DNA helicase n=1 Tax=Enterococcus sp. DIV0242_7C1 TaxID=2815323 RepID=UPI001A92CF68|nr:ATP-dependent DNA helicase [Enterococcus sp. DIV0242_7C1]MBO0469489.1 ATP-dependent DNA helicase [Enterococcus sp. DIV0242_7C1]
MRKRIADSVTKAIFQTIDNIPSLGYESREAQEDMMLNITDSYRNQDNLLIEAGVGIGKSLSYLIPGILISKLSGKPLIVATSSIQLTEQLSQDIDLAKEILQIDIDKTIGKGQKNYPCIQRITKHFENTKDEKYTHYLNSVKTGVDKQNPKNLNIDEWDDICVDGCSFNSCKYKSECYFFQTRNKLKEPCKRIGFTGVYIPKVIIVNQDLLISHLFKLNNTSRGIIYEEPCLLIIDEVHNIEEKTRSALTNELNKASINRTLNDYLSFISQTSNSQSSIKNAKDCFTRIRESFNYISKELFEESKKLDYEGTLDRLFIEDGDSDTCEKICSSIYQCIENLNIAATFKMNDRLENIYDLLDTQLNKLIIFFETYGKLNDKNLMWGTTTKNGKKVTVNYCPKKIDKVLSQLIFRKKYPTIGLSATITIREQNSDSYEYIIRNIGFEGGVDEVRNSPFNYNESRLFIPKKLPNYKIRNDYYFSEISSIIQTISQHNNGGTLVLFTAKDDLKKVGIALRKDLTCTIYEDGNGMSQKEILKQFKETGGIILGTGVFWEGIDLKGNLLTSVIIVRLPFPVPDPVIEYKISEAGNNSDKILIPEMITKLKQGSGRLIRSMTDKGILSILDSRLNSHNYKHKQLIFNSLPIKNRISTFQELEEFQKLL